MNNRIKIVSIMLIITTLLLGSCEKDVVVDNNKKVNSKEALILDLKQYSQNFRIEVTQKEQSWWQRFKKKCKDVIVVAGADVTAGAATAGAVVGTASLLNVTPGAPAVWGVAGAAGCLSGAGASIYTARNMKSTLLLDNKYLYEIEPLCSNSENKFDFIGKNHNYLLNYYVKGNQSEISKEILNSLLNEYMRINGIDENSLILKREDILTLAYNGIIQNSNVPYQANNIANFINNNYQDSYDREIMNIYFTKISTIESVEEFLEYTKGYEHIIISTVGQEYYSYVLSSLSVARFSVGYWVTSGE